MPCHLPVSWGGRPPAAQALISPVCRSVCEYLSLCVCTFEPLHVCVSPHLLIVELLERGDITSGTWLGSGLVFLGYSTNIVIWLNFISRSILLFSLKLLKSIFYIINGMDSSTELKGAWQYFSAYCFRFMTCNIIVLPPSHCPPWFQLQGQMFSVKEHYALAVSD